MGSPIFILGLTQRVGTNYLGRLLAEHAGCAPPRALQEDFLISGLGDLESYTRTISLRWDDRWRAHRKLPQLRRLLGEAVCAFIADDTRSGERRSVLKTPAVRGLEFVPQYLPQAHVIVLTRYGPDVVASGMKGFDWTFEEACQKWGEAARHVARLAEEQKARRRRWFLQVRYEDLVAEPEAALRAIFDYCGLAPEGFDFSILRDFPVYGSSYDKGGQEEVHWAPVAKTAGFAPTERSRDWPAERLRRFDELTGSVSGRIGYRLPL
jgi:hypothetical protein